jgi:hypothetical protein
MNKRVPHSAVRGKIRRRIKWPLTIFLLAIAFLGLLFYRSTSEKAAAKRAIDRITSLGGQVRVSCGDLAEFDFVNSLMLGSLASRVNYVDVSGKREFTDADLALLSYFKNLKILSVANTSVTDDGLGHLTGLNRLEDLQFNGTELTCLGIIDLFRRRYNRKLMRRQKGDDECGFVGR